MGQVALTKSYRSYYEDLRFVIDVLLRPYLADDRKRLVAFALTELKERHPEQYWHFLQLAAGNSLYDVATVEGKDPEDIAASAICGGHFFRTYLKQPMSPLRE